MSFESDLSFNKTFFKTVKTPQRCPTAFAELRLLKLGWGMCGGGLLDSAMSEGLCMGTGSGVRLHESFITSAV